MAEARWKLSDVAFVFKPLDAWPGTPTRERRRSPFSVGYARMWDDVCREVLHLGTDQAILLADCDASQIRIDGRFRSDAKLRGPGIVLVLEKSRHGPLNYPCDTYVSWDCNLRAIGLALAALRAVDRYGVTMRGEQYRGWSALPPATPMGAAEFPSAGEAIEYLFSLAYGKAAPPLALDIYVRDSIGRRRLFRDAAKKAHPDVGGSDAIMAKVNRANEFVEAACS